MLAALVEVYHRLSFFRAEFAISADFFVLSGCHSRLFAMPPWKTLLASPSHRKKEQQRERRKKSISGPLEIAVAPIGSIGRESPRPAPSPRFRSPRNSPALHSGHTSSATASPGYVIAGPSSKSPQLRRTVTAPAQCESPSTPPWHLAVEDGDSTTGEIELGGSQ